jgi:hypothetical protein
MSRQSKSNYLEFFVVSKKSSVNIDHHYYQYTVILVRPKTGESAQSSFAPKFVGEFLLIWANFVPMSSQEFADMGEIHPNRQNFARKFLRRNLTARICPFRPSFAKKKITVYRKFSSSSRIY